MASSALPILCYRILTTLLTRDCEHEPRFTHQTPESITSLEFFLRSRAPLLQLSVISRKTQGRGKQKAQAPDWGKGRPPSLEGRTLYFHVPRGASHTHPADRDSHGMVTSMTVAGTIRELGVRALVLSGVDQASPLALVLLAYPLAQARAPSAAGSSQIHI